MNAKTCIWCGGSHGRLIRGYLPGPDDGGDVVGRTPAGWYHWHTDLADCTAERRRRVDDRKRLAAETAAAFHDFLRSAPPVAQHTTTPRQQDSDDWTLFAEPVPSKNIEGVYKLWQPYPLPPKYFRKTADIWDELPAFHTYECSAPYCEARTYSGQDLTGWLACGTEYYCPAHSDFAHEHHGGYGQGWTLIDLATGQTVATG